MADAVEAKARGPRTLIVAGMHRSGTSLAASVVDGMGIRVGCDLVPPDSRNPRGYFEDVEFLALQRRILEQASAGGSGGHRDWGWTPEERTDRAAIERHRDEARALAARRTRAGRTWGWKDPRTTLLLDFWDEILDDARYLLVYRAPWDVADSMQRTGEEVFLRNPGWGMRIWSFYNRRLLDFQRRHADRCVLASVHAFPEGFPRLHALLRDRLGLDVVAPPGDPYDRALLRSGGLADPIATVAAATARDAVSLFETLDARADLPSRPGGWTASDAPAPRFARPDASDSEGDVAVSIVVPCFDDGDYLPDAVASVERHAPDGCELIVVDDGSTDARTVEVLNGLRAAGYDVLRQANGGLSAARNAGVRRARGRYVLPLDADNRIRGGFAESAIACLDAHPRAGVAYGDRELFGWRSGRVEVARFDLATILRSNYIDACAVYRRQVWEDCGGYDTHLTGLEDWEFWIHAASLGWEFRHLGTVGFDYRVRPGSLVEDSLRPEVLRRLLAHIHGKHRRVFTDHAPLSVRWLAAERVLGGRVGRALGAAYWLGSWRLRSRAWRRYRRELGRAPGARGGEDR